MLFVKSTRLACAATLLFALFATAGSVQAAMAKSAAEFNRSLGSGINLGNALEAPKEGDWGVVLQPEYFSLIKSAGLSHVRVPISWSTHADEKAPYTIDPAFFERVDWVIKQARANHLIAIINMHHYNQMEEDPVSHRERFIAMWKQIAERYRHEGDDVAFEFYNEPAKKMDSDFWNMLFDDTLKVVRATNPDRIVIVGPVNWNSLGSLPTLKLPADRKLVASIHYYEPHEFTHQGASWMGPESQKWLGNRWTGSAQEMSKLSADFDQAAKWANEQNRPMYLGEFGAYEKADMDSRVRWTRAVRAQAKGHGFSDAYWEFCSGFGVYDPNKKQWNESLLQALKVPSR